MANIELNIVALGDFTSVNDAIKKLQLQVAALNTSLSGATGASFDKATASVKSLSTEFGNALTASGAFSSQTVKLQAETEKFGAALQKGTLSASSYYQILTRQQGAATNSVKALALEQTKLQNSIVMSDPSKKGFYSVLTPTSINQIANATKIVANEQNLYNIALDASSNKLINWGKNTQWAGRQLTVGLAMPLLVFGQQAVASFNSVNKELTQFQKVYGEGLTAPDQSTINQMSDQVLKLGKNMAATLGISLEFTTQVATQFAAMGKMGGDLTTAVEQTDRLAKLGNLDQATATNAVIALQNVYKLNTTQLADAVNYFGAVQKQTSLSMSDLVQAESRVGPVIDQLGGSYKDTAVMVLAMKEAGVPAARSANALKSAMASIIAPTSAATKEFASFGINLGAIKNAGGPVQMVMALQKALDGLAPLAKQQLIEKLFGKYQFGNITALIDNLGKAGSQTANAMSVAAASTDQIKKLADQEIKQATSSPSAQWAKALATFKADLYPLGQDIMKIGTKLLEFGNKISSIFQGLPGPVKFFLGLLAGLTVLAGPIIMLTGLMANFVGNILKGVIFFKDLISGGKSIRQLLTPELIAAQNASSLFADGLKGDVDQIHLLTQAITDLTEKLSIMKDQMNVGAGIDGLKSAVGATAQVEAGIFSQMAIPGFASGGIVVGPGSGKSDSILARVSNGESILTAQQTKDNLGAIVAIMSGKKIPGFAGGVVDFNGKSEKLVRGHTSENEGGGLMLMLDTHNQRIRPNSEKFTNNNPISGKELAEGLKATMASGTHPLALSMGAALGLGADPKEANKHLNTSLEKLIAKLESTNKVFGGTGDNFEKFAQEILNENKSQIATQGGTSNLAADEAQVRTVRGSKGRSGGSFLDRFSWGNIKEEYRSRRLANLMGTPDGPPTFNKWGAGTSDLMSNLTANPDSVYEEKIKKQIAVRSNKPVVDSAKIAKQSYSNLEENLANNINLESESHSPSQKTKKAAQNMVDGVIVAIDEGKTQVQQATQEAFEFGGGDVNPQIGPRMANGGFYSGEIAPGIMGDAESMASGEGRFGKIKDRVKGFTTKENGKMNMQTKMAGSAALMMGGSLLQGMLPKGSNVSNIAGSMSNMAGMGMAFGPWGAAAGAAIGLVTGGIGALMKAEKEHAATVKATFTASADAIKLFGGTFTNATPRILHMSDALTGAGIKSKAAIGEINQLSDAISKLGKDDPTKKTADAIKGYNTVGGVVGTLKQFAAAQVAAGMNPAGVQKMVAAMLQYAGKTQYLKQALKEIIPATSSVGAAQATLLQKLTASATAYNVETAANEGLLNSYKDLNAEQKNLADGFGAVATSLMSATASSKDISGAMDAINKSGLDAYSAGKLLATELTNMGEDKNFVTQFTHINGVVKNAGAALTIATAQADGFAKGLDDVALAKLVKDPKAMQALIDQIDAFNKATGKSTGTGGTGGNPPPSTTPTTFTGTTEEKAMSKLLSANLSQQNAQLKVVKDQLSNQQKISSEIKAQLNYTQQIQGLQNDMKTAMISGNYLQAATLNQQISGAKVDFNATSVSQKLQDQADVMQTNADAINTALSDLKDAIANNVTVISGSVRAASKLKTVGAKTVSSGIATGAPVVTTIVNVTGTVDSTSTTSSHPGITPSVKHTNVKPMASKISASKTSGK